MIFDDWIKENIKGKLHEKKYLDWNILFAIALWWIWRWRNDMVFNDGKIDKIGKVKWIQSQHGEIRNAFLKQKVMSHNACYENRFLKWIPPPTY
ncbi:Non-LTR retroelement reverse transcriptase [Dorcoceras hygrometricum]|uniref:Non-LTR retroelement reverse transcriptase n=1 Tax=Dorcoceras hygrometricum TaxID=472368 RepID=A0A2Z7AZJ7_9LAMI|nr:Non-LTR retroelement reverse transcriptase [Dorcoceras hygrometricum]